MISLVIGDNQTAFRTRLGQNIARQPDIRLTAQTGDGSELIALAARFQPDVAVVDIALPSVNGLEATPRLKKVSPHTAVLIIGAVDSRYFELSSRRAGASAFRPKNCALAELVKTVRLINSGQCCFRYIQPEESGVDFREPAVGTPALNPRELEVLRLAANDLRNKEIARCLDISDRTVQSHLGHIFSKLDVHSRSEAVLRAVKLGYLGSHDLGLNIRQSPD